MVFVLGWLNGTEFEEESKAERQSASGAVYVARRGRGECGRRPRNQVANIVHNHKENVNAALAVRGRTDEGNAFGLLAKQRYVVGAPDGRAWRDARRLASAGAGVQAGRLSSSGTDGLITWDELSNRTRASDLTQLYRSWTVGTDGTVGT